MDALTDVKLIEFFFFGEQEIRPGGAGQTLRGGPLAVNMTRSQLHALNE